MTDALLTDAIDRIVANYTPEKTLLFGSRARNQATDSSDLDLLIIKETTVPRNRRGRNIQALFARSPVKLDLLFYTGAEIEAERIEPFSFMATVLKSAQVIYSRPAASVDNVKRRPET